MEADQSSETPSSRQRPAVDAVMLGRFPPVHEQGSCEFTGSPLHAAPEQGMLVHPEAAPRVKQLVSDGVRDHPPQAEALVSYHQIAAQHLLEHVRRPSQPRPVDRGLVIHPAVQGRFAPDLRSSALCHCHTWRSLYKVSAIRLLRFVHVLSPAHLERPLANTSHSYASPASQRCHRDRTRSLPQERRRICRALGQ